MEATTAPAAVASFDQVDIRTIGSVVHVRIVTGSTVTASDVFDTLADALAWVAEQNTVDAEPAPSNIRPGSIVRVKSGKLARVSSGPYIGMNGKPSISYRNLRDGEVYGPSRYTEASTVTVVG